ncbi:hypothetical protein [Neisseria sicca]|uniref:hypothetical protein n=1 Tax=Neisseria sicca TaxID=490 RepID=UPI0003804674|nr:hypothetical protein [Neisseria sicca]
MTTKKCTRCGKEKPLDKFLYLQKLRADGSRGRMAECKACKCERVKAYYRAKKAKLAELEIKQAEEAVKTALSMHEAAQQANQAFPLLSPAYWDVGAAMRAHEELGIAW